MHIKKNVFEQIINTMMNAKDKIKDDINARKDMFTYCKCKKLKICVIEAG